MPVDVEPEGLLERARAIAFTITFYLVTALFLILGAPLLLAPRRVAAFGLRAHAHAIVWLMRLLVGTRLEVRGRENLPEGPALVAAKHQSAWDTIGLIPLFRDPALVLKAELLAIPVYGWFIRKFEMIPIDRTGGAATLREMIARARGAIDDGRDVLIFPEGTRQPLDAPFETKPGVVMLYERLGVACVPVALNSGVFWPRRGLRRRGGRLVVEIGRAIPPGLGRAEFNGALAEAIGAASNRLVVEAVDGAVAQPVQASADRTP
ncbi:MAG: 1-acyl-sn-glycerol-3-phosphate acyltransferase [Rhizobiales bacterium]|nr:1-acyl-sn-glycerol-3-phosphate acyltransferase [Hyphomicrobiales bacterium]